MKRIVKCYIKIYVLVSSSSVGLLVSWGKSELFKQCLKIQRLREQPKDVENISLHFRSWLGHTFDKTNGKNAIIWK